MSNDLPRGLVFSSLDAGAPVQRRTVAVVITVLVVGLALIWPFYPLVPAVEPYLLGLPFSFAWVIGSMTVVFGALALLYRAEERDSDSR